MKVYVVGYDPLSDKASVGGFNWYYHKAVAIVKLADALKEDNGSHFYWYREVGLNIKTFVPFVHGPPLTDHIQKLIIDYGNDGDWPEDVSL